MTALGQRIMRVITLPILAVSTVLVGTTANAAGKIGYGSRAGMQVTVVSMSGLSTSNAIIRTQHTREDAIEFCREYVRDVTEQCIKDELSTRLNDVVVANCSTGVFSNFFGDRLQFRGRTPRKTLLEAKYILINLGTNEIADGSSASGYAINLEIFRALCPKTAPLD